MGIDNQHLDKPPRCLFPRQTARRSTSTCSVRAYLSQRRIITSQSTTTLIPRTSTSSRLASPLPPRMASPPRRDCPSYPHQATTIVREDTADVMLVERARRVHHLESSLLNSAVVSDVVPDVVELLLLLRLVFRYACSCIRQKFLQNSSMVGLDSSAFGRVIEIAGVE